MSEAKQCYTSPSCKRPCLPGLGYCEHHRSVILRGLVRRVKSGKCQQWGCDNKPARGKDRRGRKHRYCAEHIAAKTALIKKCKAENRAKQRAAGLCVSYNCTERPVANQTLCQRHKDDNKRHLQNSKARRTKKSVAA